MSSAQRFRVVLENWSAVRVWRAWSRCFVVGSVLKRCGKDRSLREVLESFRQTFLKQHRTLILAASVAFLKDEEENLPPEDINISDDDLEKLLSELEYVEELSLKTLFCNACGMRLVIDKQHPGINYCRCKSNQAAPADEWEPYMEADDVIIWRKEYKKGQGLYAYKVYGRYDDVMAAHFAAIQVDGAYRRQWDDAVADLSVVEARVNGVSDQDVVHWEVLWPRMFANRDYVYVRRHKEFEVKTKSSAINKDGLFPVSNTKDNVAIDNAEPTQGGEQEKSIESIEPTKDVERLKERDGQRLNVHSRARRKSLENEKKRMQDAILKDNKVFVIASRSCAHRAAPESRHAVRVTEYWSHMVVRTLHGHQQAGTEFVLTYYDEPCVGGVPGGVAAWATGRAAPDYLAKMRRAAKDYAAYTQGLSQQESSIPTPVACTEPETVPETPSVPETQPVPGTSSVPETPSVPETESAESNVCETAPTSVPEESVTSSAIVSPVSQTKDQSTQTEDTLLVKKDLASSSDDDAKCTEEESCERKWWRYLYPFYYFI